MFDLDQFKEDGNSKSDLFDFLKGWRQGYTWTIPCGALLEQFSLPIIIFDEELYMAFYLTYSEYIQHETR